MGERLDARGRLVCASCGSAGDTRRQRCPFGWCEPPPECRSCARRLNADERRRVHRGLGCEEHALRVYARRARVEGLLTEGRAVLRSVSAAEGGVAATFVDRHGRAVVYLVPFEDYAAMSDFALTPDDFDDKRLVEVHS